MDDLNVFFAFLRFPMTHAFPSISHIRSVFYAVESCSTFNGLSIANADKKCQADVFFRAGLLTSHCFPVFCSPTARSFGVCQVFARLQARKNLTHLRRLACEPGQVK